MDKFLNFLRTNLAVFGITEQKDLYFSHEQGVFRVHKSGDAIIAHIYTHELTATDWLNSIVDKYNATNPEKMVRVKIAYQSELA